MLSFGEEFRVVEGCWELFSAVPSCGEVSRVLGDEDEC